MNTWPISIWRDRDRAYLGIPDYLGDGYFPPEPGSVPTLEEVGGEDWTADILRVLLPTERAWAWCTQSAVYERAGLRNSKAPGVVDPDQLAAVVTHSRLAHGTTLAFVPGHSAEAQQAVMNWAGADTEQLPDHIWVAPDHAQPWDVDEILAWCEDSAQWTNLASVAKRPAERLLILFDRQISCALPAAAVDGAMSRLGELATRWKLRVIPGRVDDVWVTRR